MRAQGVGPGSRWTVHVANLNPEMNSEMLRSVFEHFGPVNDVRLVTGGGPTSYAFVDFATEAAAETALSMGGQEFGGRRLRVERAKEWVPHNGASGQAASPRVASTPSATVAVGFNSIATPSLIDNVGRDLGRRTHDGDHWRDATIVLYSVWRDFKCTSHEGSSHRTVPRLWFRLILESAKRERCSHQTTPRYQREDSERCCFEPSACWRVGGDNAVREQPASRRPRRTTTTTTIPSRSRQA
mmetsp:Transcript_11361/g.36027  ORF Transcript_11361/g.36027 Transcript_11361/m.36027 type:complete len:242 (+) Transcript_11361:20-745(+)